MDLFGRDLTRELVVVAEIGQNHEGSVEKAKELIAAAISSGADAAKLQSFTPRRLCSSADPERLARLERFALSEEDQLDIFEWARGAGLPLFSTPATEDWVDFCFEQSGGVIKVASGDSTFFPTIDRAAQLGSTLLVSTGATSIQEIDALVEHLRSLYPTGDLSDHVALLHCVSCYPPPISEANLGAVPFMRERYGLHVGFSSHFAEPAVALAAVGSGASVLEVHVTDAKVDRSFRDHAISLEPADLQAVIPLARQLRSAALDSRKTVQPCEKDAIASIRKGVVTTRPLDQGHTLTRKDLAFARHAEALPWHELDTCVGRRLARPVGEGFPLTEGSMEA